MVYEFNPAQGNSAQGSATSALPAERSSHDEASADVRGPSPGVLLTFQWLAPGSLWALACTGRGGYFGKHNRHLSTPRRGERCRSS